MRAYLIYFNNLKIISHILVQLKAKLKAVFKQASHGLKKDSRFFAPCNIKV